MLKTKLDLNYREGSYVKYCKNCFFYSETKHRIKEQVIQHCSALIEGTQPNMLCDMHTIKNIEGDKLSFYEMCDVIKEAGVLDWVEAHHTGRQIFERLTKTWQPLVHYWYAKAKQKL